MVRYVVTEMVHKKIKRRLERWMMPVVQHVDTLLPHACSIR